MNEQFAPAQFECQTDPSTSAPAPSGTVAAVSARRFNLDFFELGIGAFYSKGVLNGFNSLEGISSLRRVFFFFPHYRAYHGGPNVKDHFIYNYNSTTKLFPTAV